MPTSSSSETLGHRISLLRHRRKWSQAELARRVGTTTRQISNFERGSREPKTDLLGRLAEALGSTTDFLITGHDPKTVLDAQIHALVPKLEGLPQELRAGLVEFLEGLMQVHKLTQLRLQAEKKRKPRTRTDPK